MILKPSRQKMPRIAKTARVAETAVLVGDVELGENSNLWYGVVARGDMSPIVIGENTNVQDGCVLHGYVNAPILVGKNVTVGHGTILHGCTIEDNCLIGMGAVLLNNCAIGEGSIIAAGTLVTERAVIPPNSMVMGRPGKVVREVRPEELAVMLKNAEDYIVLATEQFAGVSAALSGQES